LRYLSDAELRRTIQAATNKSERFNQFVQWISFGGDSVIDIVTLSRAFDRLQADGLNASAQAMAALTPYQTEHINRFGNYTVNFSRTPEPLPSSLRQSEGQPLVDHIG
jgi:hypothetical protein